MAAGMKLTSLPLVLSLSSLSLAACVEPPDSAEELAAIAVDPGGDPDPAPAPTPPPPDGPNVLRISSALLTERMTLLLAGTASPLINVDTTGVSPTMSLPIPPRTVCIYPNQEARDAAYAACHEEFFGTGLIRCLQQVDLDYPDLSECHVETYDTFHSYLDFNAFAEYGGARDLGFYAGPVTVDTVGPGALVFNVKYLRSAGGLASAGFTVTSGNPEPTGVVSLALTSNHPTLPCVHTSYGDAACPDIELTNMRVSLRFPGIGPGPVAGLLTTETPVAQFSFDRNLNGVPDPVVTALVDVDAMIRGAVEGRLAASLQTDGGRAAINAALTALALAEVKKVHPTATRITRVRQTWYQSGQLVLAYDWQ